MNNIPPEVKSALESSVRWMPAAKARLLRDYIKQLTARNAELDAMLTAQFARRVPVEQALLSIAAGKRYLPTREECCEWGNRIGTP